LGDATASRREVEDNFMTNKRHVALLWRDTPAARAQASLDFGRFAPTADALRAAGLEPEPCIYAEEVEAEVEVQLRAVDAVLVWVNPIHDGRDREQLDALLRRVADDGVLVSAHPDTILAMGTKEVLYRTREMPWGSDVRKYATFDELRLQLPDQLARREPRVMKQNRGHSGLGIWQIELVDGERQTSGPVVRVRHAQRGNSIETLPLRDFVERCRPYFENGGLMIDQPFIERLPEGMIRCYLVGTTIKGFGHQAINALYPAAPGAPSDAAPQPGPRLYTGPDDPRFQRLKGLMEEAWVPALLRVVGVDAADVPVLWDVDLLLGSKDTNGEDTYILCEINVSSVSPFPDSALMPLAAELARRLRD
jgi:hypothetical protein